MDAFLPAPEAADNPVPNKKGSSTIFLWVALVLIFVAIYNVLSVTPRGQPSPSLWERVTGMLGSLFSFGWPFMVLAAVFTYLWWQFRGGAQFQLAQEPGLTAIAEGKLDEAAAVFRGIAEKYRKQMQYAAVARYDLARVMLRQGKLEGALSELMAVEKGAGLLYASAIRLLAAVALAECYALRGNQEAAQRWIDESRKRLRRASGRTFAAGALRIAETILQCRAGRFDDAVRGLERDWRQLEGNMALSYMREAWLFRAYATAQLGGPRGEGAAAPFLTLLRGASLDHLAVEWPELQTFLVANGLTS